MNIIKSSYPPLPRCCPLLLSSFYPFFCSFAYPYPSLSLSLFKSSHLSLYFSSFCSSHLTLSFSVLLSFPYYSLYFFLSSISPLSICPSYSLLPPSLPSSLAFRCVECDWLLDLVLGGTDNSYDELPLTHQVNQREMEESSAKNGSFTFFIQLIWRLSLKFCKKSLKLI